MTSPPVAFSITPDAQLDAEVTACSISTIGSLRLKAHDQADAQRPFGSLPVCAFGRQASSGLDLPEWRVESALVGSFLASHNRANRVEHTTVRGLQSRSGQKLEGEEPWRSLSSWEETLLAGIQPAAQTVHSSQQGSWQMNHQSSPATGAERASERCLRPRLRRPCRNFHQHAFRSPPVVVSLVGRCAFRWRSTFCN